MKPKKLEDYPTKVLISRAQGLHCSIYVTDCFSSHDMLEYDAIVGILEARGYELRENSSISFVKEN